MTDPSETFRDARVIRVDNDVAWLDVGAKFESVLPLSAWQDAEPRPKVGDAIPVVIEDDVDVDDRPLRIARVTIRVTPTDPGWTFVANARAGDIHPGRIARRIKGGFIVDIGVTAFLPNEHATGAMLIAPEAFLGQVGSWRITRIDLNRLEIQIAPA